MYDAFRYDHAERTGAGVPQAQRSAGPSGVKGVLRGCSLGALEGDVSKTKR